MHADIAGAERAQDRIGQGVEPDIGIGMALEPLIMGTGDAAHQHLIPRSEAMDVETVAAADIGPGASSCSARRGPPRSSP